ncbi:MAG: ParA family protein, partial [bacterium]
IYVLKEKLKPVMDSYDYILIDTHPTLDILSTMSLMTSDYYCIPIKPEPDSLVGINITDSYLKNAIKANKNLKDLGILLTDFDKRTNIAHEVKGTLEHRFGNRLMDTVIGRNVAITDAAMNAQTIFQYDQRQRGCEYFRDLAKEIIKKCENKEVEVDE